MEELNKALAQINAICDEWKAIKSSHSSRSGWMFDYKLYKLSSACEDTNDFDFAAEMIYEDWAEAAREAAGYVPKMWDYSKYFEHDKHHGSYFTFREDIESEGSLDFWANDVGLEWDATQGDEWCFTPFEKAVHECYGTTRFSTDKLKPEDYSQEEIDEIANQLVKYTIPSLCETLKERKAVIEAYDKLKEHQCEYMCVEEVI